MLASLPLLFVWHTPANARRGITVSHETVRQWAREFGQAFASQIRRRLPCAGDKWHLDGVSRTHL